MAADVDFNSNDDDDTMKIKNIKTININIDRRYSNIKNEYNNNAAAAPGNRFVFALGLLDSCK